ncbi:myotubularin-related protein 4 isoform X1 [Lates japonicus]|uniref:Myotubularin-related protein 4 isoform X1 n=1 Tax=Lates japonicus TaxID=270547 RepID=A0AAD3M389_LATJO|nr:myotubularin-related protein 4 isoform X1 [Lates japonicus]
MANIHAIRNNFQALRASAIESQIQENDGLFDLLSPASSSALICIPLPVLLASPVVWGRCSHQENADDVSEQCPVFLQWLDCVYQLLKRIPLPVGFNRSLPGAAADLPHSGITAVDSCACHLLPPAHVDDSIDSTSPKRHGRTHLPFLDRYITSQDPLLDNLLTAFEQGCPDPYIQRPQSQQALPGGWLCLEPHPPWKKPLQTALAVMHSFSGRTALRGTSRSESCQDPRDVPGRAVLFAHTPFPTPVLQQALPPDHKPSTPTTRHWRRGPMGLLSTTSPSHKSGRYLPPATELAATTHLTASRSFRNCGTVRRPLSSYPSQTSAGMTPRLVWATPPFTLESAQIRSQAEGYRHSPAERRGCSLGLPLVASAFNRR